MELIRKMKAAILLELNKPLVVDEIETPELQCGQVLVNVHYSGICGAQLGEISGAKGPDKYLPHLLGHEGGGVVVDVGPGVKYVKKGDHVAMHWRKGIGIECEPPKYKWKDKVVGGGWITTFNEYSVVSENRLTKIDNDIPLQVAALMGCCVTTALGIVNNEADIKIGQTVAIAGCGGVGLSIIRGATGVLASQIIAIDMYDSKLIKAVDCGATLAINSINDNIESCVRSVISGGVDVFIDCTGNVAMIDIGLKCVSPGGKLILVGQPSSGKDLVLHNMRQHYCGKTIIDSQGGMTNPTVDIPRYLGLYKQGKLELDDIITDYIGLDNINDAIDSMRAGNPGRFMVKMI